MRWRTDDDSGEIEISDEEIAEVSLDEEDALLEPDGEGPTLANARGCPRRPTARGRERRPMRRVLAVPGGAGRSVETNLALADQS